MANLAYTEMYLIVTSIKEHKEIIEIIAGDCNLSHMYPEEVDDPDNTYPMQIELGFDTKWGLPHNLLKQLVEYYPNVSWNATSCEPGGNYRGLASYHHQEETLLEKPKIHYNTSEL